MNLLGDSHLAFVLQFISTSSHQRSIYLFYFLTVCVWGGGGGVRAIAFRDKRQVSLDLELQMVLRPLRRVLGAKLRPFA